MAGIGRNAPVILMYHRVASPAYDPWGLCVAPERFRDQLGALKKSKTVLSMAQLVDALDGGDVPPQAAAITFDDGYSDNEEVAKPILEELGVPATMFLTTSLIGTGTHFWWDELAALVLAGRNATSFDFNVGRTRLRAAWPRQERLPDDLPRWRYTDKPSDPRRAAYMKLWSALQQLDAPSRDAAMARLRELLGNDAQAAGAAKDGPMSRRAAESLPSSLLSIGGHGRTHVPLTSMPAQMREEEITCGRVEIAAFNGGRPPDGFAYPHGLCDAQTRAMVERAGYRWAVSTSPKKVNPKAFKRFALPRVEPGNRTGDELLRMLRGIPC